MGLYLCLAFAWSWGLVALAFGLNWISFPLNEKDPSTIAVLVAFMCGPMVGGVVAAIRDGAFRERLRLSFRPNIWWLRAWAFPVAFSLLAITITLVVPGAILGRPADLVGALPEAQRQLLPSGLTLDALILFQALVVGAAVNSIILLSEELGWRGYMLSRLSHLSFWRRHLTIGFVWGVWHAPVIAAGYNYPGEPFKGPLVFILFCVLLSPVIGHFSERGKSVFAASIFHGTFNAVAPMAVLLVTGVSTFERAVLGWPGLLLLFASCLWLISRPRDDEAPAQ